MPDPLRVLIVEDSADDTLLLIRELRRGGFDPQFERVETAATLRAALQSHTWDVILCDYSLPQLAGTVALQIYRQSGLEIPFIAVSGSVGEERVAELMRAGAHDYVMKGNLSRLVPAIRSELSAARERRDRRQAEAISSYLASLVQSCDDAIVGTTLDGIVVSWNHGAERIFGYTAEEIIGRSISVLMPPYRPDELAESFEKVRRGESVDALETIRLRKGGVPVEISLTVSPIRDSAGRIAGASGLARDITRRKAEENERLNLIKDLTSALTHVHP